MAARGLNMDDLLIREVLPVPKPGDVLRVDGFEYILSEPRRRYNNEGQAIILWHYRRREEWRKVQSDGYKREGLCLDADMVWTPPPDFQEMARAQSVGIIMANPTNYALKEWAEAAADAVIERFRHSAGCWTLGGRHLPARPPVVTGQETVADILALLGGAGGW